jgi:hypothetical protein
MAEVDGKVVLKSPDGRMYRVPHEEVEKATRDLGWEPASDDEAAKRQAEREQYAEFGSTGQQALGALEQTVRTGTFGLVPGSENWEEREAVLREHSPVVSFGAQALGAVGPGLATGGLASGAATAAGLGRTGVGIASAAAEGLAGGLADEVEQARYETRDVSAGNVFLYGLGGEIAGRALPKALSMGAGKVKRALTAVDEAADIGVPNSLAATEAKSVKSQAKLARDMPEGPERAEALINTADEQYATTATETAAALDEGNKLMSKLGDTSSSATVVKRLKETIPDQSPAQMQAVTAMTEKAAAIRKELTRNLDEVATPPVKKAPVDSEGRAVSLEGVELSDMMKGADTGMKDESLEFLRNDKRFLETGKGVNPRITDEALAKGNLGHVDGIIIRPKGSGKWALQDGRHRITVAREKGMPEVFGRVLDSQNRVLYEGMIPVGASKVDVPTGKVPKAPKARTLANSAGLRGIATEVDTVLRNMTKRLDESTDNVDWFLNMRKAKQDMQGLVSKMGRMKNKGDEILHAKMQGMVDEVATDLKKTLSDQSLFGKAAEIEADINGAWHEKWFKGIGVSEGDLARKVDYDYRTGRVVSEYDPAKVRSFLKGDAVDRQLAQKRLDMVIEGWEDMAEAHTRHGTASPEEIQALRNHAKKVRNAVKLADEIQVAKAGAKEAGPKPKAKEGFDVAGELLEFGVEKILGTAIPFAGQFMKFGKRLLGIDSSARAATKATARNLAGVGAGYTEKFLSQAADLAGVPTVTALSRFSGDYHDPEASFAAKRKLLEDEQVSPTVLYETLGQTMGDLPKVNPELFQKISQRTAEGLRYLRNNMPAGLQMQLLYPNGTPPSRSALREWATMWNTFTDPSTVLDDINNGTAVPLQMQTLRDVHPDIYDQLKADVIEQVGTHFQSVPTSTKAQLDLLFQADGLAGPMWSSAAADQIGKAMAAEKEKGMNPGAQSGGGEPLGAANGPGGIEAIQSSVTNKGG